MFSTYIIFRYGLTDLVSGLYLFPHHRHLSSMDASSSTCEIVESREEIISEFRMYQNAESSCAHGGGKKYSVEDDIDRLFQAFDFKNSARGSSTPHSQKSALKRPIKVSSSQASGIGIAEPVSLKQALRGLCISQASEMAALKRLSKPSSLSRTSEAGTIKKLYSAVVDEGKGNLVEISLVPEISAPSCKMPLEDKSNSSADGPTHFVDVTNPKTVTTRVESLDQIVPLQLGESEKSITEAGKPVLANLSTSNYGNESKVKTVSASSSKVSHCSTMFDKGQQVELRSETNQPSSSTNSGEEKSTSSTTCLSKPKFRNMSFLRRKVRQESCSNSSGSPLCTRKIDQDLDPSISNLNKDTDKYHLKQEMGKNAKLSHSSSNHSVEVNSNNVGADAMKSGFSMNCSKKTKSLVIKIDGKSRSREKGEFSQSSKSSIGECSSSTTTSISEESNLSGSSRSGHRPHMSKHLRWEAVRAVQSQHGNLSLKHFKLLRRLGCGDIGTVYLAELIGTSCLFALKVMDNEFLANRKKIFRAQTEREILQMLDHPFLPTLYAYVTTDKTSCLVMEYCPGGDLHVLRQRQPYRSFSEQATRFYVAEVLLAVEYLHMLGVIYRDLKPENILVREDGHIMLTDFDLSLRCSVNPTLVKSYLPDVDSSKKTSSHCAEASCIHPFCLQPDWQVSCFSPILLSAGAKSRKMKSEAAQVGSLPQLVAEPTSARSNSFVGTYEYLAPEIVKGEEHGSAVDWWTFGIFLFELLYGKTPFKGTGNEETLSNVVSQSLKFPDVPIVSFHARDLIRGLLIKDPQNRLGSVKGAAEIKQHPFFEGLNWALIRCAPPPEMPRFQDFGSCVPSSMASQKENANDLKVIEDCEEFQLF